MRLYDNLNASLGGNMIGDIPEMKLCILLTTLEESVCWKFTILITTRPGTLALPILYTTLLQDHLQNVVTINF